MRGEPPPEILPTIGSVENPAIFYDGRDLLLCYEVAPVDGGGHAFVAFDGVVRFEQNTNNVHEGLRNSRYPVRAWDFTEVFDSDRTVTSRWVKRRFWTISFNDVMVEIVFAGVRKVRETRAGSSPRAELRAFVCASDA